MTNQENVICLNLRTICYDFSERSEDPYTTGRVHEDLHSSFKMKTINTIRTTASAPPNDRMRMPIPNF